MDKSYEKEYLLAEYTATKQGMLSYENVLIKLLLFSFTATSALFAIAFNSDKPIIFLLSFFFLIPIKCRYVIIHGYIRSGSDYIAKYIEPFIPELRREGIKREFRKAEKTSRKPKNYFYYYTFTLLSVASILLYLYHSFTLTMETSPVALIISLAFSLYIYVLESHVFKNFLKKYSEHRLRRSNDFII